MVQIGTVNRLTVKRITNYGADLDGGDEGDIPLLKTDLPANCQPGDGLAVFVYVDRDQVLRATTSIPKATVGQFARLQVAAIGEAGAFLDWGLRHDLFVPKGEQLTKMVEGQEYVVFITLAAESRRIIASSKLEKYFSLQPPSYGEGDEVDLIVYGQTELGYKAVVDGRYGGLIYKNEVFQNLFIGQELKGYIKKIREDCKIDLILQRPGYQKVDDLAHAILQTIIDLGGTVAVTDKSSAVEIYNRFGVSKKTFKKALGSLYKKRLVTMDGKEIRLVKQEI